MCIARAKKLVINSKANVSLNFVKKHANRVSHLLARLPCKLNSFVYYSWMLDFNEMSFIKKKKKIL